MKFFQPTLSHRPILGTTEVQAQGAPDPTGGKGYDDWWKEGLKAPTNGDELQRAVDTLERDLENLREEAARDTATPPAAWVPVAGELVAMAHFVGSWWIRRFIRKQADGFCGMGFFPPEETQPVTWRHCEPATSHPDADCPAIYRAEFTALLAAHEGGWRPWAGGECPVHPEQVVEILFALDGVPMRAKAGDLAGWRVNAPHRYVAWRPAKGGGK